jgi:N-acetylmuramoyl-L-alanine amidase
MISTFHPLQPHIAAYSGVMKTLLHKISWLHLYLTLFLVCFAMDASEAVAQSVPLSISTQNKNEELALTLPSGAEGKVFTLANPPRLVVDIPNAGKKPDIKLPRDYAGAWVKNIRSGQFNTSTGRVVFELSSNADIEHAQQGRTLTITLAKAKGGSSTIATATVQAKPVVILDPGHGGEDPGATGPRGTREKVIVLAVAKELKKQLESTGKYKVVLTRKDDYFVRLRERVAYARKNKGNIFISIHADSAPTQSARGLSVYTISENASDKEAEALAARENRSDAIAGMDLGEHDQDVANILISLAQRETNNQSAILADKLTGALRDQRITLLPNTHRMAGFAVLKAPDIPSVLVETGFISHPEEEKKLGDAAYRARLTKGLADGIDRYFQKVAESK